jgi:hypothetical protein
VRRSAVVSFLVLLILSLAAEAHSARLTVCVLSFHTPHEVGVFESHLPPEDFEVVNLTSHAPFAGGSPPLVAQVGASPRVFPVWDLCRSNLRCDVVVYSAEFAGRFFGQYGASLTVQDMEEASCQARCAGFFHHPREVFLLACNTLATKDEDHRTPAQYLQILVDHGFDRASAERVVQLRYGPLGPSFRETLRRIFKDVPRIYGFSSVSPAGNYTAPLLERYFRSKGDYRRYLEQAGRDTGPNRELLAAFHGTGLIQTSGLTALEPGAADREVICALYDEGNPVARRLEIIRRLMDRDDLLGFLPAIQVFVDRHPPAELSTEEQALFEEIRRHDVARERVLGLVYTLDVSALQLDLAHFAVHLGWMTPEDLRVLAVNLARRLLVEPLTNEVVDTMCEIPKHASIGDDFRSDDLPEHLFHEGQGIRLIDCLAPRGPRVSQRLVRGLDSPDVAVRVWTAHALTRRHPLPDAILVELAGHLQDPVADVSDRLRWIFRVQAPLSDPVDRAVSASDPGLAEELRPRGKRRRCCLFW